MRPTILALLLLPGLAAAAPLAGYSGFIRVEARFFQVHPVSQPIGAGSITGVSTEAYTRATEFQISQGVATGAFSIHRTVVSNGQWVTPILCINQDVGTYSEVESDLTRETASGSAPGTCDDSSFPASVSCTSDGVYHDTVDVESNGTVSSPCAELPSSSSHQSTSTPSDVPGFAASYQDTNPGSNPIPNVVSGTTTEVNSAQEEVTTTWMLVRDGQYEIVFEPDSAYDDFRPQAGPDELTRGNALPIKAKLQRKDGKPLDNYMKQVTWRLSQRSHEPGVAMNDPPIDKRQSTPLPDLMFEGDLNAPYDLTVGGEHGIEAVSQEGSYEEVYALVSAFDWGAYGAVTVEAVLQDGEKVYGHMPGDSSKLELLVPKRSSVDDPIAAVWRTDGPGRNGDALSDDEASPVGDGHLGDGFTLYEEYRGFKVDGRRLEGDPQQKELFIHSDLDALTSPGVELFKKISGLLVHPNLTTEELGDSRELNFNSTGRFQIKRQHGVLITWGTPGTGFAQAVGGPSTPGNILRVTFPIDLFKTKSADFAATVVAHELGHCANVYHHGENDIYGRRWRVANGLVYETDASDASAGPVGSQVTVFNEDGSPWPLSNIDVQKVVKNIGVQQGQHSGDDTCVMRYDDAKFSQRTDTTKRYRSLTEEPIGYQFCSSNIGSGVNDLSHPPVSRFGDANTGVGACSLQICINDAFTHPSR